IEEYLNNGRLDDHTLDPDTRRVANTLLHAAESEHPRPGFINELALQMREQHRRKKGRGVRSRPRRLLQLASTGVAFLVLIAVVFYATGLLRPPAFEPLVQDAATPDESQQLQPASGPLAGHRLRIMTE